MTFQFNPGDVWIDEITVDPSRPERWSMPPDLAGVLWIDNQLPFHAAWRENDHARRSAQAVLAPVIDGQVT